MKLQYKLHSEMVLEVEVDNQPQLFEEIAKMQEVFDIPVCKNKAGSESNVYRFVVRKDSEDNKYYEVVCMDFAKPDLLYSKIQYGMHKGKGGGLFPKNGKKWVKYDSQTQKTFEILTGKEVIKKQAEE